MSPSDHDRDHDDATERDAWLSEALRHAPDAQAAPPAALSAAILRQARATTSATQTAVKTPARGPWAAAWGWLARPPVTAGFASVMVATLLGLIWWDRPIDPTLARAPSVDARSAPMVAPTSAPVEPASEPNAASPAGAKAGVESAPQRQTVAAPKPAPRHAEPAPQTDAPTPTPTPTPAPAPTQAQALRAREAPMAAPTEHFAEVRPAAFDTLLASVAAQPERWGWERRGTVQPMHPALQRWLARLDAEIAGASGLARAAADTAASSEASVLRLYRDGVLAATLRLDDASVGLVPGPGAMLAPSRVSALKQTLDDATR